MQLLSKDMGIDLGTSNVLIYVDGRGVIIREPSVIAIDRNNGKIIQVGAAARNMLGRTPGNIAAMSPMKDGIISDHEMTVRLLESLISSTSKSRLLDKIIKPKPRVVISVPSGITEVEERTVINAVLEAGARRVYLIEAPLAAGLGAGLDIKGSKGHMVVDVGGGATDIAVLSMNGVSTSSSMTLGGNTFDDTIARYIRREYGIVIGKGTAEDVKIQIASVASPNDPATMTVKGREVKTGIPREIPITSSELYKYLIRPASAIADEVLSVLENSTPELVGDISENGITLTGGGCQLRGLDRLMSERTGIICNIADDPASCVAYGCGKSLAWINHMTEGPIKIARKRAMHQA